VDDDPDDAGSDPTLLMATAALRGADSEELCAMASNVATLGAEAADEVFDAAQRLGVLADPRIVGALRGSRLGAQRRLRWATRHPRIVDSVLEGVPATGLVAAATGEAGVDEAMVGVATERALTEPQGVWAQCYALLRTVPSSASLRLLSRFGDAFFDQLADAALHQHTNSTPLDGDDILLDGDVELLARVAQRAPVAVVEDLLEHFDFSAALRSARRFVFRSSDRYRPCRAQRLCAIAVDWADVGSDDPRLVPRWMAVDRLVELFPWEFVEHADLIRSVLGGHLDAVKILESPLVGACRDALDTWDAYTTLTSTTAASAGLRDHEMGAVRQLCMFELGRHRSLDRRVAIDAAAVQPAKVAAPFLLGVESSPVRRGDEFAQVFVVALRGYECQLQAGGHPAEGWRCPPV
jgi:hypothetical protein